MGKPILRTRSIGFKVSEEEYVRLATAAQTRGLTLGEWCREVMLQASDERPDPVLAEILGVRLLLVNVLRPLLIGQRLSPETFDRFLDEISQVKHELAAKLRQAAKKAQPDRPGGDGSR